MSDSLNKYFSGVGRVANLTTSVAYIFDESIGESGVLRPATPGDLGGGAGAGSSFSEDSISTFPYQKSNAPSNFAPSTSMGTVFTLASGEQGYVGNLGTNPLLVKLGASATSGSFNYVLKPNSQPNYGDGGDININNWVGAVSVASVLGSGSYIAWKI